MRVGGDHLAESLSIPPLIFRRGVLPSSMGFRGAPKAPRSPSNRDEVGAHPNRAGLVGFPKGTKAHWSMGVQGESGHLHPVRGVSRGSGSLPWSWGVGEQEGTLTGDATARRCAGGCNGGGTSPCQDGDVNGPKEFWAVCSTSHILRSVGAGALGFWF